MHVYSGYTHVFGRFQNDSSSWDFFLSNIECFIMLDQKSFIFEKYINFFRNMGLVYIG